MALATTGSGGIVVRGLKKKFVVSEKNEWGMMKKKIIQAVNGLDLTVADKTIFCLLGCRHISTPILLFLAPLMRCVPLSSCQQDTTERERLLLCH
jgi:hypothetical protein